MEGEDGKCEDRQAEGKGDRQVEGEDGTGEKRQTGGRGGR